MNIICFPHFCYLSQVSRLVELGKVLRERGQEVVSFSHGGSYEYVATDEGFNVCSSATFRQIGSSTVDGARNAAREIIRFLAGDD